MRLIKSNSLTYIHWRKYEDHTFSPFFPEISGSLHSSGFWKSRIRSSSNQTKFDKVADVIVIGSGFAGLAAALEAKEKGMIRHIGITNHRLNVAHEAIESGLYETLQFPFCYLATDKDLELVQDCKRQAWDSLP